jgi:hypothetical protein
MSEEREWAREAVHEAAYRAAMADDGEPLGPFWEDHEAALDRLVALVERETLYADHIREPNAPWPGCGCRWLFPECQSEAKLKAAQEAVRAAREG